MKNISFKYALIFTEFFVGIMFSQEYCAPEYILPLLSSEIDLERSQAVDLIEGCNNFELLHELEDAFAIETQLYIKQSMIEAIHKLNSPNTQNLVYDFINSIEEFEKDILDDEYYSRLVATKILFDLSEYSNYQYIFDYVENRFDRPAVLAIQMLSRVIDQLPQYAENARVKLENYSSNSSLPNMRAMAITYLTKHFGAEYANECISKFYNDESYIVRNTAFQLISSLNVRNLNTTLRERLSRDTDWSLRVLISDTLIKKFGEPLDLKAVIDYQPNEPDETARSLMAYSINNFIPPKPDTLNWSGLITKLISYTEEMFQYDWIQNEETRDYYAQRLTEIYEAIENTSEIGEACSIIDERIPPQVEQDLGEQLVTNEAYKFLHYYTIYIKEEIKEEFGPCQ